MARVGDGVLGANCVVLVAHIGCAEEGRGCEYTHRSLPHGHYQTGCVLVQDVEPAAGDIWPAGHWTHVPPEHRLPAVHVLHAAVFCQEAISGEKKIKWWSSGPTSVPDRSSWRSRRTLAATCASVGPGASCASRAAECAGGGVVTCTAGLATGLAPAAGSVSTRQAFCSTRTTSGSVG